MREILFRGQRIDTGEWVYGFVRRYPDAMQIGEYSSCHIDVPPKDPYGYWGVYNVIEKSVGQYIGLKDKNGAWIFEGDVVAMPSHGRGKHRAIVYFRNGKFAVDGSNRIFKDICPRNMEIIGNIHDNPEFLKG